ncbi:MAG: bifunctional UDP-N-acetylglucosamine diphosphorylase/glucosamine-1-phosphate N-acetyltransferase GlmU [Armatimonadota bacterium]
MPELTAVILAAGKGTRMKSALPKALHPICGKPMTRYVVDACRGSGIEDCIVVVGHGAEQVKEGLGNDIRYAVQAEQKGTGHACAQALALVEKDSCVLVTPGDTPLIQAEMLSQLVAEHTASGAAATLLTTVLPDAGHYGRVLRGADGAVLRIVEAKDATPEEIAAREINTSIYCFDGALLAKYLKEITPANAQGEYYLTDVIGLMVADGRKVGAVVSEDPDIVLGVNNRVDLAYLTGIIRRRILDRLMLSGVTLIDPQATYVDDGVEVGADTVIHPGSHLLGGTKVGEGCTIGPSARLVNVQIGNNVTVLSSNLDDSTVGDGTRVGPFANIRPGCKIGKNVKIGDFVEAKNAEIEDSVSMGHLAYIGDAVVGERTNIGAGTITCNYDGYAKHRTVIGRNVFVGSDVTIVAPLNIGDGALIAAGSTITEDVPGDALAVARSKQAVKEGWARRRREEKSR